MSFLNSFKYIRESNIKNSSLDDEDKNIALANLNRLVSDMSEFDVKDSSDVKDYFYIRANMKNVINKLSSLKLSDEQVNKLSKKVYTNRNKISLDSIHNFYISAYESIKDLGLPIKKLAYPQGYDFILHNQPYNINNWLTAAKHVVAYLSKGMSKTDAIDKATENWDKIQKMNFDKWLQFYHHGEHMKYKMAQISLYNLKARIPGVRAADYNTEIPDLNSVDEGVQLDPTAQQAQTIQPVKPIKQKRELTPAEAKKQLLSRITSAEKIFTDNESVRGILGDQFGAWLKTLHQLKEIIQLAPVKNASSSLLQDLIYKEGNKLNARGFNKAASIMYKLAQDPAMGPPPTDPSMPPDDPPGDPSASPGMGGDPGAEDDPDGTKAMEDFIAGLSGDIDVSEDLEGTETQAAPPAEGGGGGLLEGLSLASHRPAIYRKAQDAQVAPEAPPVEPEAAPEAAPEAKEQVDTGLDTGDIIGDDKIENALKGITIEQAITKAEMISQLYKSRMISRELQVLDLYLQALDIDTFFNQELSEALNKSLESNQYGLTRIESIMAKLRGASESAISITDIRSKFQQQLSNEQQKRENRAKQDMAPAQPEGAEGQPAEVEAEELKQPVEVEQAPAPAPEAAPVPQQ